jgi:uncharacterized protein YhbP (UPF0306 family)
VDPIVRDLLADRTTLTLACADGDGPWAADVYFVRVGTGLYFYSSPTSRHSMAFRDDPRAAGTIHAEAAGWRDIRGVQLEGAVSEVEGKAEKGRAVAAYFLKFPFAAEVFARKGLSARVKIYRFSPSRALLIANAESFGARTEISWK